MWGGCYAWATLVAMSRLLPLSSLLLLAGSLLLQGCGRFHPGGKEGYVYVISKGTYIRERLAPVSDHVEDITNGEKLAVVEHDRRFYKVRTPSGKVGWLEEHSVIDQVEFDKFAALSSGHASDPIVAKAVLRDSIFLHLTPGRKTEHLYLLPENDHLELIVRASVPKPLPPQAVLQPRPPHARRGTPVRPLKLLKKEESGSTVFAAAPPHPDKYTAPDTDPDAAWMQQPMEDWWLVRDAAGKVGWVLARGFDIEVPDEVAQYSEGRHIVGAYLLNTVMDSGEPPARHIGPEEQKRIEKRAETKAALLRKHPKLAEDEPATPPPPAPVPHPVGQYVTVTAEFKDGLPYDWDQVRVFIWNRAKHRYETAYRLREQQGYLPVVTGSEQVPKMGEEPTFTIRTTPDGVVSQDENGSFHPKDVLVTQYRLEGGIVRRDTPLPPRPGDEPDTAGTKASSGAHAARGTRRAASPKGLHTAKER